MALPSVANVNPGDAILASEHNIIADNLNQLGQGYTYVQTVYFTSSGSFTKATYPWLRAIRAKVQGAGGGGGGLEATGAGESAASGGGGGGAYAEKFITDIAGLSASVTVTVGSGGAGGNAVAGSAGGQSAFGTTTANGGGGGSVGPDETINYVSVNTGGLGSGTTANADLTVEGSHGLQGFVVRVGAATFESGGSGGMGGDSFLGRGGRPGNDASGGATPGVRGGGGGGYFCGQNDGPDTGGAGGAGIVIVELYA